MKEDYETKAYFWVSGFESPHSQITELMGLEPTDAWHKGDPGKYITQKKESAWQLHSPLPKNEIFLDSHISALLKILEGKKEQIQKLKQQYEIGINCVGYYKNANPGFHLSEELINKCSSLGLSIDFDLYCLNDDSNNENAV